MTLIVSGTAVVVSSFIGLPLGAWLGLSKFRGKRIVELLILTGMAMPPVVVGLAVTAALVRMGIPAWWVLPVGIAGYLAVSMTRK